MAWSTPPDQLTVATATRFGHAAISRRLRRQPLILTSDGAGGTLVTMQAVSTGTSFRVSSASDLSQVIGFIDAGGASAAANTGYYTITLNVTGGVLNLTAELDAINLMSGLVADHHRQRHGHRWRLQRRGRRVWHPRLHRASRQRHDR